MIQGTTPVRFIGGKYNGFNGTIAKICENVGSFWIGMDGEFTEVVEELRHVQTLAEWQAAQKKPISPS